MSQVVCGPMREAGATESRRELRQTRAAVFTAHLLAGLAMLLCAVSACPAEAPSEGHLQLDVRSPRPEEGRVGWAVYNSADGFPADKAKAVRHGFTPDVHGQSSVKVDVGLLPPGRYAVSVYLDENGNGRLDSRIFGIPKEPVGASNNPPPRHGPPRFNDCAFSLGENDKTVVIELVIPK